MQQPERTPAKCWGVPHHLVVNRPDFLEALGPLHQRRSQVTREASRIIGTEVARRLRHTIAKRLQFGTFCGSGSSTSLRSRPENLGGSGAEDARRQEQEASKRSVALSTLAAPSLPSFLVLRPGRRWAYQASSMHRGCSIRGVTKSPAGPCTIGMEVAHRLCQGTTRPFQSAKFGSSWKVSSLRRWRESLGVSGPSTVRR